MQTTSETVSAIFAALGQAQATMPNPRKNAINPRFGSGYSTLDEGLNVAKAALSAVGICIIQTTYMDGTILMLETKLGHTSGEWIASHYPVIGAPFKPQEGLSSLTYARRAALFTLVGIAGEDDDDGNAANKVGVIEAPKKEPEPELSEDAVTELFSDMTIDLDNCQTIQDLDDWAELYRPQKHLLKKTQQVEVTSRFNKRKADIKTEEENNG
jgi:hypothetical protein